MSAERSRRFGALERQALLLALVTTACFSLDFSDNENRTERSAARFIDHFCDSGDYDLEGSGKKTSGLTSDSCGFSVGPGPGVVRFKIAKSLLSRYQGYEFSALVASADGTNPRWLTVIADTDTVATANFEVAPENGKLRRIVDVRVTGELRPDVVGCSVAKRRGRSR